MKTPRPWLAIRLCLLLAALAHAQPGPAKVTITMKVKTPASTPADAKLYLTGSDPAMGSWRANGIEMKKADDGTFSASVALPKNIPVEYKITRGSWETVEKNPDGSEMNNRTLTPADETTLDFEIGAWADKRPDRPADPPPAQPAAAAPVAPTTPAAPPAAPPPQPPAKIESTATGDIRTHRIHSRILDNNRSLYVWLPPGYSTNKDQKYAILYMHDGQNLFDRALNPVGEWQADETAARLIAEKKIQPLIIVGIANTALRMDEYTLTRDERMKAGGNGDAYIRFVVGEVKPFIDRTYRTKIDRDHTGVGGSSLGATISLEICREHPEMFGRCAAISPSLWWNNGDILRRLSTDHAWVKGARVWIDLGSNEAPPDQEKILISTVDALSDILRNAGAEKDKDFKAEIIPGATHIETAWAKRFDQVLMFLFPPD